MRLYVWDRCLLLQAGTLVVDGRNCLDPSAVTSAGLVYEGIGRSARQ